MFTGSRLSGKRGKDEVLRDLLAMAVAEWGEWRAKDMQPSLEVAAEAILDVEKFKLGTEEEPASMTRVQDYQGKRRR